MIPEDVAAIMKIQDRTATDEEIEKVRVVLNAHPRETVQHPDFPGWLKLNKDVVVDYNRRRGKT